MTANPTSLDDTGERMIPGFHKGTVMYAEHLTRYVAAKDIAKNKVVLDIASGSGYGTKILSETAKKVYGVDVDEPSIEYAKKNFPAKNIEYLVGDGERIPLDDNSVDFVITLETIEHIPDYTKFIKEIKRVLKDDGIALVSTPNEKEFTKGNHFHLHEFQYDELTSLVKKEFSELKPYFQATWVYVAIGPEELMQNEKATQIETLNLMPLAPEKYLYFYLLCSNRPITEEIKPLGALGGHYSARELVDIQNLHDKIVADYKIVLANAEKAKADSEKLLNDEVAKLNKELESIKKSMLYKVNHKISSAKHKVHVNSKKN